MELSPYLDRIAGDLERVTALADDTTREVTGRLLTALEPSLRMAFVEAITDAVSLVTAELDDAVAVVHLEGREPVITVERGHRAHTQSPPVQDEGEDNARVTVRLPQGLKERAEGRAAQADQSLNTWIVQAIRRSAQDYDGIPPFWGQRGHTGRRVTGWA